MEQVPERDDSIFSHSIDKIDLFEPWCVYQIDLSILRGLHFLIMQGKLVMLSALFFLGDTGRTGSIPSELWTMTQLDRLRLWGNYLNGTIPPGIGSMTNLLLIGLHYNDCK